LDDVVVVALALRYAARRVPREVLEEAWPGEPGCWNDSRSRQNVAAVVTEDPV
jgi:uncharacterized membrane protein YkvA (DUF1232 family)